MLLPCLVAVYRIYAYVQDLGIERGELLQTGVERRQLLPSSRGPIQRVKCDHHVLLATIVAEPDLELALSLYRRQLKVRCACSNLQWHSSDSPVAAFYMEDLPADFHRSTNNSFPNFQKT